MPNYLYIETGILANCALYKAVLNSLNYCNVRRDELRNLIRDSPIHIYLMQETLEASSSRSVAGTVCHGQMGELPIM